MHASRLHVFTARFNPIRWQTPDRHYREWVEHVLDSGVTLHVIECQYGERPFVCNINPHIHFTGVRAASPAWTKENLINLAIHRAPEAEYIAWIDSDIFYEKPGWPAETLHALQIYHWVQPWSQAIDRGPNGEVLNNGKAFRCFGFQYEQGAPLVPDKHGWKTYGCEYPHPGFAHASTRRVLDHCGGLFDLAGMGAADHAMCLALVGKARAACPPKINQRFLEHLLRWQARADHAVHGRIGYVNAVINHRFHGAKANRQYLGRWSLFLKHGFDPDRDLKRNSYGVLEWSGTNRELEREWLLYLRARREDDNAAD